MPIDEVTPWNEAHAALIGVLLANAKLLPFIQRLVARPVSPDDAQLFAHEVSAFIHCVNNLYERDGKRLEQDTLALAATLGLMVEQHYVNAAAGGVH